MCEINHFRRSILARHFPGIPIYSDVRTINPPAADIVFGGPPCQRTSVAAAIKGKRTGSSLWPYMLAAADGMGAEWVIVEQPPGNAEWEAEVSRDLCRSGRHCARVEFAAGDLGAPYQRRRVYILACASLPRLEIAWSAVPSQIEHVARAAHARGAWNPDKLRAIRVDAGAAAEVDRTERIAALGDSNPPEMAEVIGRAIMAATGQGDSRG